MSKQDKHTETVKLGEVLQKSGAYPDMAVFEERGVIELTDTLFIKVKDVPHVKPDTTDEQADQ